MAVPSPGLTGNLQTIVNAIQQVTVQMGALIQAIEKSSTSLFGQTTGVATSASAGLQGAPPDRVDGYMIVNVPGVGLKKVPYYDL